MNDRALTLAEVLVAGGVLALMSGLLLTIYITSYGVFRRGTTRMHVQQQAREILRRLTPLVMSSIAPTPLEEAVYLPAIGEMGRTLEFYSADDLLAPMAPINARAPDHFLFRIELDAGGEVHIRELSVPARVPTGNSRLIARHIYDLDFERLAVNAVRVRVQTKDQVRTVSGTTEDLVVERTAVLAIPYYSSAR